MIDYAAGMVTHKITDIRQLLTEYRLFFAFNKKNGLIPIFRLRMTTPKKHPAPENGSRIVFYCANRFFAALKTM